MKLSQFTLGVVLALTSVALASFEDVDVEARELDFEDEFLEAREPLAFDDEVLDAREFDEELEARSILDSFVDDLQERELDFSDSLEERELDFGEDLQEREFDTSEELD
ncbi:hypothetical protein FA15DRAFT_674802 [Coprinopsis marcescibilis]|uniref:Uncharacterized protein n=1 Tax=Coprinopsis marcescibilis TaxID=230819 RepID=A0A5C3KH23_COPMA|nr:hypothetical protein FA15DRAFT_674802 [Coprinopsis marcescibilis]